MKIINRDDFSFPQPLYIFGQTLYTEKDEEVFVIGMKCDGDRWEYELFYLDYGVIGNEWITENKLSISQSINEINTQNQTHLQACKDQNYL